MSGSTAIVTAQTAPADAGVRASAPDVGPHFAGDADTAAVRVERPRVTGLLVVRADPERDGLGTAFERVFGLDLPPRLESRESDDRRARWLGPDEWLVSAPLERLADLERDFRDAVGGGVALSDVSGGYVVLRLAGDGVLELLAKCTSLDVDPRVFGPGRVASTVFAKATATLGNLGDGRYEIVCRRSFADYVARWLGDAGRERGIALVDAL